MSPRLPRIAILGYGAIGRQVVAAVRAELAPGAQLCVVRRHQQAPPRPDVPLVDGLEGLIAWAPDLVVECAGHAAVRDYVPAVLAQGSDVILVSTGALADPRLRADIDRAAARGQALLLAATGAIGGIDALQAARRAGLSRVRYTGRKPPQAWQGTPAEQEHALDQLREATVIFAGNAATAAVLYPRNANVTAAVALAGLGFEDTEVRLVADPAVAQNIHELDAEGAFGRLQLHIANAPLPQNAKSSWLAALSVEREIEHYLLFGRHGTSTITNTIHSHFQP